MTRLSKTYPLLMGILFMLTLTELALLDVAMSQAAPDRQNSDPVTLVAEGDALLWESKFSEAEAVYDAAIETNPDYAPAYAHRCSAKQKKRFPTRVQAGGRLPSWSFWGWCYGLD